MYQILKFLVHRTMHLQSFDSYGSAAALSGASDAEFKVSGVRRDQVKQRVRAGDGVIQQGRESRLAKRIVL
jgi:hypothetical protein